MMDASNEMLSHGSSARNAMQGRNQEKTFGRKTDKVRISGLDEAIDDFKHGRVYAVGDLDDYFKRLGADCAN